MQIKTKPEDFIVKEITNIKSEAKGDYLYFILKKQNYNTINAIDAIAKSLHIPLSRFGFAGNKDKNAITEQLVSVKDVKKDNLERLKIDNIEIAIVGYGSKYISLGELIGNEFIITIRKISNLELDNFNKKAANKPILMLNYFGEQRFSLQNADIGKALVKRDFKKAAELLKLDIIDNDFIGAIRKINKKILRLYIHSYQSYIFNETIKEYVQENILKNEKIPIVGFGTELEKYNSRLQKIITDILKKETVDLREFITVKIPELSEEGSERDLFVEIKDLKIIEKSNDKVKIRFFLQKGSYATEAIKYLFN